MRGRGYHDIAHLLYAFSLLNKDNLADIVEGYEFALLLPKHDLFLLNLDNHFYQALSNDFHSLGVLGHFYQFM